MQWFLLSSMARQLLLAIDEGLLLEITAGRAYCVYTQGGLLDAAGQAPWRGRLTCLRSTSGIALSAPSSPSFGLGNSMRIFMPSSLYAGCGLPAVSELRPPQHGAARVLTAISYKQGMKLVTPSVRMQAPGSRAGRAADAIVLY